VDEDLYLGIPVPHLAGEVRADADNPVYLPGQHEFPCLWHRGQELSIEVRGQQEASGQLRSVG
jgi:hypothetical protein